MNVLVVGLLCSSIGLAVSKVLTTLRFFREFILGLFIWICVFFEDLRVASFSACFISKLLVFWACFLQISCVADSLCLFSNFMAILLFDSLYCKMHFSGAVLCKYAHFGLVFRICLPVAFLF